MRYLLAPLAAGFGLGVKLRRAAYRRGWFETRKLDRPVVSVGNLTVGGSGKTPLVGLLLEIFLKRGWRPCVLTRGYGRRSGGAIIVLEPGSARAPTAREVGDEGALLARKFPQVPIVVAADRYRAGRLAEERFKVDVHLLDDGFQHWGLARDVDVVLLDVTQGFSDCGLLPAGRLREPWAALERAHIVVLTRAELGDPALVEAKVRRINPQVKSFVSTTKLCGLLDVSSGAVRSQDVFQAKPVFAFCGIGNPKAFFADLRKWGYSVSAEFSFRDHHAYSSAELSRLGARAGRAQASALVTTEKDAMNFPLLWESRVPIVACRVESEVTEAEDFEEALMSQLEPGRAGQSPAATTALPTALRKS